MANKAAQKMVNKSKSKRSATGGNKNITTGAKRQGSQTARVAGVVKGNLKGPNHSMQ